MKTPSTQQVIIGSLAAATGVAVIVAIAVPFVIVGAILNIPSAICHKTKAPCITREL